MRRCGQGKGREEKGGQEKEIALMKEWPEVPYPSGITPKYQQEDSLM